MRGFGVLLHISSLPSPYGIGDLGQAAHAFVRSLGEAGASAWQFLPVHPTSTFIGNSPYSSPSAFAGNPLFISPEALVEEGIVSRVDVESLCRNIPGNDASRVDFTACARSREHLLRVAFERCAHRIGQEEAFTAFCREHHAWLHDYARFVTLKAEHGGASWVEWPPCLRQREEAALSAWDAHAAFPMLREKFIQYLFFSQWRELRRACAREKVALISDLPIYLTHDSADVWVDPRFFNLDGAGLPVTVAGVPPDYFSQTGQRWGNPVYRWDVLAEEGFAWWKRRIEHELLIADLARLDHFRGFCGYWEIPAEETTAVNGQWTPGPGGAFFAAMREHFGSLPFIAEDLGVITDDVRELLRTFDVPGMHVLQFAFGGEDFAQGDAVPHRHTRRSVVYTGVHDNPPTRHWFSLAGERERTNLADYAGTPVTEETVSAVLMRLAFSSVADLAVVPMQDALNLGMEGRMNIPGTAEGNWGWRMTEEQAQNSAAFVELGELARVYGRLPLLSTK